MVTLRRVGDMLLAYTPVFVCACLTVYSAMRAGGYSARNVISFFASSGLLWAPYLFLSSLYRGFCRLHRVIIVYDLAVSLLMYVELWRGFASLVRACIDVALLCWGLYLLTRVVRNVCRVGFVRGPWHKCATE